MFMKVGYDLLNLIGEGITVVYIQCMFYSTPSCILQQKVPRKPGYFERVLTDSFNKNVIC